MKLVLEIFWLVVFCVAGKRNRNSILSFSPERRLNSPLFSAATFVEEFRSSEPLEQIEESSQMCSKVNPNVKPKPSADYSSTFIRDACRVVGPSVVRVNCDREIDSMLSFLSPDRFKEGELMKVSGSGLIMSKEGHIVTNEHVVSCAKRITVTLPSGRTFKAQLVESDELSDLAVLKAEIDSTVGLSPATLGDSSLLIPGDWVIALGCPTGLDFTVTLGIVSSPCRSASEIGALKLKGTYIQTDAALNSGNSGGPLVNARGEVVGINSMTRVNSEAIGFAIPINRVKAAYDLLKRGVRPLHGYFGVEVCSVTPDGARINNDDPNSARLPEVHGALVTRVVEDSPATKQLRRHDVIVEINGQKIRDSRDAEELMDSCKPGRVCVLKVLRGESSEPIELQATPQDLLTVTRAQQSKQKMKAAIHGMRPFVHSPKRSFPFRTVS